ncbi:MAG: class I SAM-dependent DNA methyltransferase [Gemmatimonadales bacterium]
MISYRHSHQADGYGATYERTYGEGYYRVQWEEIERPLLTAVFEDLRHDGARSLLDFACGTGRVTLLAESMFPRVVGVDVAASMLAVARGACRSAELIQVDLTRAALPERFDVVTAFRFFLNAEQELREGALDAIRAVLSPGGTLLANVHVNRASPLGLAYRCRNRVTGRRTANVMGLEEMEALLTSRGFRLETVTWYSLLPRIGWLFPPGSRALMVGLERFGRLLPGRWQRRAQSFLVRAASTDGPR